MKTYSEIVNFDQTVITTSLWSAPSNSISITLTGTYFISLTIEVPFPTAAYVMMMVNQVPQAMLSITDYNMTTRYTMKNGIISGRTACMLQLNINDVLTSAVYKM